MAAKTETAEHTRNSPRIDMRPKVTGSAEYIEDLPEPDGLLYGAVLTSPYSHARIVSIDSAQAERLPGVVGVLHRDYIGDFHPLRPLPRNEHFKLTQDQPFMAIDKARYNGEVVAIVAAEDLRTAQRAVDLIEVNYEPLPHIYDGTEALGAGAPLVHEQKGTNLLLEDKLEWGDIERGFKEADRIFEETYTSPAMFHHPMENVGGCIAQFADGKIDLLVPTNAPFRDGNEIAHFFKMAPEDVRLRVPYIGGGFGSKNIINAHLAALFLSRKIGGRPIKLVPSAQESFLQNSRHAMLFEAKIGVKLDGTITALRVELVVNTGAYTTGAATATHNAVISGWGCYRIPNLKIYGRCAYTNKVPAGHTRATGKVQTTWAVECMMDNVARQLGIDPVAFRRKNVLVRGEFVTKGTPHMDTDFLELIDKVTSATENAVDTPNREDAPPANPKRLRGKGMALSLRHGSFGGGQTDAMAVVDTSGTITIRHNAPDLGQGIFNLISVITARSLDIPQGQVSVALPDTSLRLAFMGVNSQRTTIQLGTAVYDACQNLKQEMIRTAAQLKGGSPDEWTVVQGHVCRAERSFSFSEIVRLLGPDATIKSMGAYRAPPVQVDSSSFAGMDHWAPSAAVADVEVDPDTGEFEVLQYAVAVDAGEMLHYKSAIAQLLGGAVMGFGHALFEEMVYSDGQILNGDPFQYRLPVSKDLPISMQTSVMEHGDGPGPFGSILKECRKRPSLRLRPRSATPSTTPSEREFDLCPFHRKRSLPPSASSPEVDGRARIMLPPFKILNTNSIGDAVSELARLGDQAKLYGGGTELLILLRHNLLQAEYLLNIKPIAELSQIRCVDDTVRIGASVTHRRMETEPTILDRLPMLAGAESQVANIRVRGQGTIGGNLCFNDPHSDPATALLVYDASVTIEGSHGARQIPLQQFLRGMYSTALEPDELLVSIDVPCLPAKFGSSYLRIHRLQRPTLTVGAAASRRNGAIEEVRLAVGCVGPMALRLTELEAKIRGVVPSDSRKIIRESKTYLKKTLEPIDDLLGSAEYKIYIAGVLLERALAQALENVEKKQDGRNG